MPENSQIKQKKPSPLSLAIFLITISVVLISLVSVVFPALIVRTFSPIEYSPVSPWELGPMALNLILVNIIIFGIGFAYYKNKLPLMITNAIKFIFNFEVSKKITFIVLAIMMGLYISSSIGELGDEERGVDSIRIIERTENWSMDKFFAKEQDVPFRFLLLSSSIELFDNIRVIPFIASIALVILIYFITLELSQKRFAGLVAVAIILQSFIFLKYDTRSTYDNFWTLFYILSLYLIYKTWPLSPILFVLSLLSKPLTAAFLPMTLFFIYRAELLHKKKVYLTISYFVLIGIGLSIIAITNLHLVKTSVEFSGFYFWQGFTSVAHSLRFDFLVILFLLPLTVGLFLASRKGIIQADSILILIAGILFSAPLLTGFTDLTNQPYRFIPLIVFFSIGVGIILSKGGQKTVKEI